MNDEEFIRLHGTYGADLATWPHHLRGPAMALLRRSPTAQQAYADARALDAILRSDDGGLRPDRRAALVDSIMDAVDADAADQDPETHTALSLQHGPGPATETPDSANAAVARRGANAPAAGISVPRGPAPGHARRASVPDAPGMALPGPSVLVVCLAIGVFLGAALFQATQLSYSILPEHGEVELWMR